MSFGNNEGWTILLIVVCHNDLNVFGGCKSSPFDVVIKIISLFA